MGSTRRRWLASREGASQRQVITLFEVSQQRRRQQFFIAGVGYVTFNGGGTGHFAELPGVFTRPLAVLRLETISGCKLVPRR